VKRAAGEAAAAGAVDAVDGVDGVDAGEEQDQPAPLRGPAHDTTDGETRLIQSDGPGSVDLARGEPQ
jgi:hypothetical protein